MRKFVRNLKRGTNTYKGMIPLKCFNFGGIGHFSSKCTHKNKESDEYENPKKKRKIKRVEGTKINYSRKVSTPRKEYSSWH
jgi:hypothetical protein